ncbi:hypothetical protein GY21_00735 [Cryobacterium roopkundense]|uniref:Uncharacterized protein n=1 Tax=Cryobacterium roopkundense TaxID=1001240 RepID=A0A099JVZ4_9MICO|nr:hypothetical protein [Cryobacterium roopkundense]KGJ82331.1 hypothetical protein GY21_00735 [Cryobacterium roopkundense]MBB5639490.1 hypothetical protein [Cryobacterium roopkundense]
MSDQVDYRLVLPPGWARIPLDERAPTASNVVVNRAVTNAPVSAQSQVRRFVTAQLREVVQGARSVSGVDLYLPVDLVDGAPVALSIVVSAPELPESENSAADALLAFAARGGATAVEVGGRLAVRQAGDAAAVFGDDGQLQIPESRRISYAIVSPIGDRLLIVTGSMLRLPTPDADRVMDALEQLFDAMALSVRFAPAAPVNATVGVS